MSVFARDKQGLAAQPRRSLAWVLAVCAAAVVLSAWVHSGFVWSIHRWLAQARRWRSVVGPLEGLPMLVPGILALALTPRRGRWAALGLKKVSSRWIWFPAILTPLALLVPQLLLAVRIGGWPSWAALEKVPVIYAAQTASLHWRIAGSLALWLGYIAFLIPLSLGEELLWRGLFWRELARRPFRPWAATWVTGLCWTLWHLPFDGWSGPGNRLLPCLSPAFMLSFLRLASGSIWPCVVFHAVFDATGALQWAFPETAPGSVVLAMNGIFVLECLPFAFALWLRVRRVRRMTAGWRQPLQTATTPPTVAPVS